MDLIKCKQGDLEKIIYVANNSFATDRPIGYDFKKSMAKVYDNKAKDFSEQHFAVQKENGEFVAIAGNLIDTIKVDKNRFCISKVGTVSTLPQFRGKGCMQKLMSAIDDENNQKKVTASILTGDRNRYKNFGYDRIGLDFIYTINKNQAKWLNNDFKLTIENFNDKNFYDVYQLYIKNNNITFRSKQDFLICTNNAKFKLCTIKHNNKIIGYFVYNKYQITELCFSDNKYLQSFLFKILSEDFLEYKIENIHTKQIEIYTNIFSINLCKYLDCIADKKRIEDGLSVKVYNFKKFIKFLFLINNKKTNNICEVYQIANKKYCFNIKDGKLSINSTKNKPQYKFNNTTEFLRYITGNLFCCNVSAIFPLYFGLNIVDRF